MLSDKAKSYLAIVANLKPTPSFFAMYIFVWLVWHSEFALALATTSGDFSKRIAVAINAVAENQYILVLVFTVFVVLLRYGFDQLSHMSNEQPDENGVELLKNSKTAATENEMDIKQLMTTLEKAQEKLVVSREKEKKVSREKNEIVGKMLRLQAELDESLADNCILNNTIDKLQSQLDRNNDNREAAD